LLPAQLPAAAPHLSLAGYLPAPPDQLPWPSCGQRDKKRLEPESRPVSCVGRSNVMRTAGGRDSSRQASCGAHIIARNAHDPDKH
jgi:hypothetical protein